MSQDAPVVDTRPLPFGLGGGSWRRVDVAPLVSRSAPVGAVAEVFTAKSLVPSGPDTPVADPVTTPVDVSLQPE